MAIVKANKDSEAGVMPSKELLAAMGKFNEEMVKAGVTLPFAEGQVLSSSMSRHLHTSAAAKPPTASCPGRLIESPSAALQKVVVALLCS
jgi:hypothetical protein